MLKERNSSLHATSEEATGMLTLVSEFHTNNFHYLVVSINMLAEGKGIDALLQQFLKTLGIDQFLEVDRFELNHHLCAIVEAKSDTAKSDLNFLKITRCATKTTVTQAGRTARGQHCGG